MTTIAKRSFRIFGPNAGKSGEFGGHYFREGILFMQESPEVLEHVTRKLSRYGAFPRGSEEYDVAERAEAEAEAEAERVEIERVEAERVEAERVKALENEGDADGIHDTSETGKESGSSDQVQGGDGSSGEGTADTPPVDVSASDNSEAGREGVVSEGDGHQDPELPGDERTVVVDQTPVAEVNEKMRKVVLALDPGVDEHWVETGQPAMAAIEEAYGADFAREDVHNAVPDWNREKAQELKDLT